MICLNGRLEVSNEYFEIERNLHAAALKYGSLSWVNAPDLLKIAARALKCEWATLWIIDPTARSLFAHTVWNSKHFNSGKLNTDTRQRHLTESEGMLGHIWKSRSASYSKNLEMDMALPRSLYALGAGLQAGFWLPVKDENQVYAVIELLGVEPAGQIVLPVLDRFGTTLGRRR